MASIESTDAQAALHTCPEHEEEELDMYCRTCKRPMCHECIRENHVQHQWLPLRKFAKELRANAHWRERELTSHLDTVLNGHQKVFRYFEEDSERRKSQNMSTLENTRSAIHRITDEIIDKRKREIETFHNERKRKRESLKQKLQQEVQKLKVFRDQLKNESTTLSNLDIIELYDEIDSLLSCFRITCKLPESCSDVLEYTKGNMNRCAIEEMIGHTNIRERGAKNISLTQTKSHIFGKSPVTSICPISDSSAWIRCDQLFRLVTLDGKQITTSDSKTPVYNFDVTLEGLEGQIMFCDKYNKLVSCITESSEIETLYSTNPLNPTFISTTHSGDHFVSLVDEISYTRDNKSRRIVRRVTRSGEIIKEYEYEDDGRTPLFIKPTKCVEHFNADLCVLNRHLSNDGMYSGSVIGLTYNGSVRFRYEAKGMEPKYIFNPIRISCDMLGNTLIADCKNRCIHLIDSKGTLVKYLLIDMEFEPCSIAFRDNRVWIGSYEDGQVCMYDYTY